MSNATTWTKPSESATSWGDSRLIVNLGVTMGDGRYTMGDSVATMGDAKNSPLFAPANAYTKSPATATTWTKT